MSNHDHADPELTKNQTLVFDALAGAGGPLCVSAHSENRAGL